MKEIPGAAVIPLRIGSTSALNHVAEMPEVP